MSQCRLLSTHRAFRGLCGDFSSKVSLFRTPVFSFCSAPEAVSQVSGNDEPASRRHPSDISEIHSEEVEVGASLIRFETGKLARFAAGAVVLGIKETKVLSTVVSAQGDGTRDFLPLTVDYQEKQYAQGKIPNTFMRREGAPKERELLCGRVIDRSIRPLFPKGFFHEVQVMASVISSDGEQDPDVMAANASSAALMTSNIPWSGPIGVVRVGRIDGKLVVNPDMDELSLSDLNLVYSCTRDKTLMIETQAREISNQDLIDALHFAHLEANKLIDPQLRLAAKVNNQKKNFKLFTISDSTLEKIKNLSETSIQKVFADPTYGKMERGEALGKITDDVKTTLAKECDEESLKVLPRAIDTVRKMAVRRRILEDGIRVDGRHLDEVRLVQCESGPFSALHGSSIFSRGNTQVLCTVTLGAPGDAQKLESLVGPPTKRFMLHYSFPPFSINEIGRQTYLNRREVGHGTLAEKALLALLPPEEDFPYSVRVNSEVMASDGSTSMATVCGGSMALMDAGVPLRKHVAGVSVGLVTDVDPDTGGIKEYCILTDILGLEDHLGDMDFKIAGTRDGITAIQLDIKPAGIPLNIICESLDPALKARSLILDRMEQHINCPRSQIDENSPRLATLKYNKESLWRLIGPQRSQLKKLEELTGARITVNADQSVTIFAKNQAVMENAQEQVEFIVGREIEVGGTYKGVVVSIQEYGAFVEFNGGQQGLLHISELSHEQVSKVSDVVQMGQKLSLMCIGQDVRGNIKLSLKATLPRPKSQLHDSIVEESETPYNKTPSVISDDNSVDQESGHEHQLADLSPSVIIRSVEECDQHEASKSSLSNKATQKRKASAKLKTEKSDRKSRTIGTDVSKSFSDAKPATQVTKNKRDIEESETPSSKLASAISDDKSMGKEDVHTNKLADLHLSPSIIIQSAEKCDQHEVSGTSLSKANQKRKASDKLRTEKNDKYQTATTDVCSSLSCSDVKPASKKGKPASKKGKPASKDAGNKQDTLQPKEVPVSEKQVTSNSVKIGDSFKAKVEQIRAYGLVLQLGNGLRGMYRFEPHGKRDFQVGDDFPARCSSFSSKGIPVMSLAEQ